MADVDDLDPEDVLGPPPTGEAAIDDALLGLAELRALPVAEHPDRLARAHEALQSALDAPIGEPGAAGPTARPAVPGVPGGPPGPRPAPIPMKPTPGR